MRINWKIANRKIKKLQRRIAKAVNGRRLSKAKALCWLLTNSFYARVLAVVRVIITNKGGKTPGVDGVTGNKNTIIPMALSLKRRGYQPLPLRRIYIPKRNGKKRPLSIPTIRDRAMQALYLMALEPIAEAHADKNSYGFRRNRSCRDAIEQVFSCLSQRYSSEWILEADIKSCFDKISHEWLLNHVFMDKSILRKWLKAGYIENRKSYPTLEGTPQGGIISPTLMNITLDGLEKLLKSKFPRHKLGHVNFVRYADDFIVTARTKELLEQEIVPLIRAFLAERGLTLSDEKTKITHISEGFDFLSQNVRKYENGRVFTKPSQKSVIEVRRKLRTIVFENLNAKPQELILKLNSLLRGWANYHRHIVSKEIFKQIDFHLWYLLGKWCKHRHPNKAWKWIRDKYFSVSGELCTFSALTNSPRNGWLTIYKLFRIGLMPIIRHTKVRSEANPFDAAYDEYFEQFQSTNRKKNLKCRQHTKVLINFEKVNKQLLNLWKLQPANPEMGLLRNA